MRQQSDSTAVADSLPLPKRERVSIDVDYHHPLLRLKRALEWEAIQRLWQEVKCGLGQGTCVGIGGDPTTIQCLLVYSCRSFLMLLPAFG